MYHVIKHEPSVNHVNLRLRSGFRNHSPSSSYFRWRGGLGHKLSLGHVNRGRVSIQEDKRTLAIRFQKQEICIYYQSIEIRQTM